MLKNAIMISALLLIAFFTQPKSNQEKLKEIKQALLEQIDEDTFLDLLKQKAIIQTRISFGKK